MSALTSSRTRPSEDYRRLRVARAPKVLRGPDALADRVVGYWERRSTVNRQLEADAAAADLLAPQFEALPTTQLQDQLREFATAFRRGLVRREPARFASALAAVREAAHRFTGMRPFRVQLVGALALDRGMLAEMATGEGKSLTAAVAAVFAAWRGEPCHIVTVNDYLAERDAKKFGTFFRFCGLTVAPVVSTMEAAARRDGYAASVTYTTSKEVVADFLRDRLALGSVTQPERFLIRQLLDGRHSRLDHLVMRGLGAAIIDEADSVLIDEAVTPLIICQPRANDSMGEAAEIATELAAQLERDTHYRVDLQHREVELLDAADQRLADAAREMPRFWSGLARRRELVTQALSARELYQRDRHYVVQDGKIVIVDEFTGRLMPQRSWRGGLHQAVEAKEKLALTPPTEILARLSFQRFFRGYRRLSGMTGTGVESAEEFWRIYRLPVLVIPTNRPCVRIQWADRFFARSEQRWEAVVREIVAVHTQGRPVLAGTRSVAASEDLARRLGALGLDCQVLNAVRHREEAEVIARAGEAGRITIATNLAGRGTDILLGSGVAAVGGLHVIATEPNESGRVDRQLFGRAGRQGNPGTARRFASLDDDLVQRFVPAVIRTPATRALAHASVASTGSVSQETIPVNGGEPSRRGDWLARRLVGFAQLSAQRQAARQRSMVLRHDTWLDEALSFTGSESGAL